MSEHGHLHAVTREEILLGTRAPISRRLKILCVVMAVIGTVVFICGAAVGSDRAWQALHFNWLFFASVSSAGVMVAAVQRITTARWSRVVVRFIEGFVAFLPVAFVLLLLIIFVGRQHIFPWATTGPSVHEKALYLNLPFFFAREIVLFGIIMALSLWFVYLSVRLDVGVVPESGASWAAGLRARMRRGFRDERREIHTTHSKQGYIAVVLALMFGTGWIVMSWDLSMSLDIHFQSTMYGWWFFMGAWVTAIAAWTLLTIVWRRHLNRYDLITEHHFHDFGKLCFAFTAFWGYLTFSQYLVIWYGNLAEETHWARLRLIHPWAGITIAITFLMFVLPFFGLLARSAKVYIPTMAFFAACLVVGLWLVRYDEIYPSIYGELIGGSLPFGFWEISITVGLLGLWGICYIGFMEAFPRMRVVFITSPFKDEVQIPVNPKTMEPLPAHE